MGVLPLQFRGGENVASLGLTGKETFSVSGVGAALKNGNRQATVTAAGADAAAKTFTVDVRIDTPQEVEYYRYGGILPYVLRQVARAGGAV